MLTGPSNWLEANWPETYNVLEGIICLEPKTELKIESTKNALKESFPDGSVAENLPTKQETWVQFLGQEDPLEKEMANSLQYSCLEDSMDRGAWQAIVHEVAESWTWLRDKHFHTSKLKEAEFLFVLCFFFYQVVMSQLKITVLFNRENG